jgi:MFS family permease
MGSLNYVGLAGSAPMSGYVLSKYKSKRAVMTIAILGNAAGVLLYALATRPWMLYVSRIFCGFTQGPIFVYAPVWIDDMSPASSQTIWMSLLQVCKILCIILLE